MSFELRGLDKLQKRLNSLATLADVQGVVKKHGSQMHQSAMRKSPVDSGALKRSIVLDIDGKGLEAKVGSTMEYAPYIEYGTGIYATNGAGRKTPWVYFNVKLGRFVKTQGMRAQPFIRPSYYEQRNKFTSDLEKLMK